VSEAAVHQAIADARARMGATTAIGARDGATTAGHPPVDVAAVRAALAEVPDPEIPVVSVVDLGMVEQVSVRPTGIRVTLLPTFVGCPALDLIRSAVEERLGAFGVPIDVSFEYQVPWTSERITPSGREKLQASGFAPPNPAQPGADLLIQLGTTVPCPHCGSRRTVLENAFGPTRCRAIYHCTSCRQPFETFKTI
jgi:ring-1,2-phenylacetyl-CoA epoxidase subunit PaaD